MYKKSLFIFRRALRLDDNHGLAAACAQSENVIPCFIFDPRQVSDDNGYRSTNAIQFMIESLKDLAQQLNEKDGKLYLFYGDPEKIIKKLIKSEKIDALFLNRDYTPFSIKRDRALEKVCNQHDIAFENFSTHLINQPEDIATQGGTPYAVFTPFFKYSAQLGVDEPKKFRHTNFYTRTIKDAQPESVYKKILPTTNKLLHENGGRDNAQKILRSLKKFSDYAATRDIPNMPTTNLAAHLKFGTVSVREVFYALQKKLSSSHPLVRQLYWRDFFTHVAYHSPFVFGQPYHEKYKNLWWSKSKKDFAAWRQGKTGFPIVDAGMRQLNATGFMHNRVRMIVASFLTKDLHIDWRWGEKYFAQQLVDYDPCVNNGNWQWSASTGCDAQPYFRIFNPWLQQKKFDPECVYIKEWVPELKKIDPRVIHNWFKDTSPHIANYPRPMVDHKKESALAKEYFKAAASQ